MHDNNDNPTMIRVNTPHGYYGSCAVCDKDDRQDEMVKEYVDFEDPLVTKVLGELGLPPVKGFYQYVHKSCQATQPQQGEA
jgi:hypothetical protein